MERTEKRNLMSKAVEKNFDILLTIDKN